jgi:predicted transcriptional regulator
LARGVDREVESAHRDVHTLWNADVIQKADDGRPLFPFDTVRVDSVVTQRAPA